jgi:hypothetical protein
LVESVEVFIGVGVFDAIRYVFEGFGNEEIGVPLLVFIIPFSEEFIAVPQILQQWKRGIRDRFDAIYFHDDVIQDIQFLPLFLPECLLSQIAWVAIGVKIPVGGFLALDGFRYHIFLVGVIHFAEMTLSGSFCHDFFLLPY